MNTFASAELIEVRENFLVDAVKVFKNIPESLRKKMVERNTKEKNHVISSLVTEIEKKCAAKKLDIVGVKINKLKTGPDYFINEAVVTAICRD